jgi:hypothetical protein
MRIEIDTEAVLQLTAHQPDCAPPNRRRGMTARRRRPAAEAWPWLMDTVTMGSPEPGARWGPGPTVRPRDSALNGDHPDRSTVGGSRDAGAWPGTLKADVAIVHR